MCFRLDARAALREGRHELVELLIDRLRFETKSMWRADALGGEEHMGWGDMYHLITNLQDLLQMNTWATIAVASKKRPPKPKLSYRPKQRSKAKIRPKSVMEMRDFLAEMG